MQARNIALAAGLAGVLSFAAYAATGMSAQDFVTKASVANLFEIESSKLALVKSQNGDVRTFAQQMVDDHGKTGEKLKDTLQSSTSGAIAKDSLDSKHQKLMDRLEAATGAAFDTQYITMQTDAHKEAVNLFGDYARNGTDNALKDFASETLPALQEHLKHVQELKAGK